MDARLIGTMEINAGTYHHVSITEAARLLVVSVSTLRRRARGLGIRRFSGRAVAGGMVIDRSPALICITYSR